MKIKEKNFMKSWINRLRERFKPSKTLLIEMKHTNGTLSHFVISSKIHKFNYSGNTYIIDEERKIYNNTSKVYMFRYHEGFALPYEINITVPEMKKGVLADHLDISTSFNPSVLKDILKFEYAKGVIQGAEVSAFIKRSFILGILCILGILIHLALDAYKSGWI